MVGLFFCLFFGATICLYFGASFWVLLFGCYFQLRLLVPPSQFFLLVSVLPSPFSSATRSFHFLSIPHPLIHNPRLPSTFSPLFMDGTSVLMFPSTFSSLFMDGRLKLNFPSTISALFMDEKVDLSLPSTFLAVFMDGNSE